MKTEAINNTDSAARGAAAVLPVPNSISRERESRWRLYRTALVKILPYCYLTDLFQQDFFPRGPRGDFDQSMTGFTAGYRLSTTHRHGWKGLKFNVLAAC